MPSLITPLRVLLVALLLATAGAAWSQGPAPQDAVAQRNGAEAAVDSGSRSESEWWLQKARNTAADVTAGTVSNRLADALYDELEPVLRSRRDYLMTVLDRSRSTEAPLNSFAGLEPPWDGDTAGDASADIGFHHPRTVAQLYDAVSDLYQARLELLPALTLDRYLAVTGTYTVGMRELRGELEQIRSRFELHEVQMRMLSESLPAYVRQVPLFVLGQLFQLVLALAALIVWRRWARTGLPRLQSMLLDLRPRRRIALKLARLLWYFDRVRVPLELGLLLMMLSEVVEVREISSGLYAETLRIAARWILIAWFIVRWFSAFRERRAPRVSERVVTLRTRSIHLIATWLVMTGLSLDLVENLAGRATLYEWIWSAFWLAIFPVLLLLLLWWRGEIRSRLEFEARRPEWVSNLLAANPGKLRLHQALAGFAHLTAVAVQRRIAAVVGRIESGRRLVANYLYRETLREHRELADEGEPIDDRIRDGLLDNPDCVYEKYARAELKEVLGFLEENSAGVILLVGERGTGKSLFLDRLAARAERRLVSVEVGVGDDADRVLQRLCLQLDADPRSGDLATALHQALSREGGREVVVVEDVHRLARPCMNGQRELDRLSTLLRSESNGQVLIFTLDKTPWQYLRRVRHRSLHVDLVVTLPQWDEEQIGELIELRTAALGLEPDYSRFFLPPYLDEPAAQKEEDRQKLGFFRILWAASDGNVEVALRLYIRSLLVREDGSVLARTPPQLDLEQLEASSIDTLLVLRVIAQSGYATAAQVAETLVTPLPQVESLFTIMRWRGWIEEVDGHFRITWRWFRPITRVLSRQNLIGK